MPSKTIKVSNVKDTKYGKAIGYKEDGQEWENYFVNDKSLFQYIRKGATLNIEYKESDSGALVITGVAADASAPSPSVGGRDTATGRSIELQVIAKAYAEMFAAKDVPVPTPLQFAECVVEAHALIFVPGAKAIAQTKELLDAEEVQA